MMRLPPHTTSLPFDAMGRLSVETGPASEVGT